MGTGQFASYCLDGLLSEGITPSRVITMPPRKGGRGLSLNPTLVDKLASEKGLNVYRSLNINKDAELLDIFAREIPDVIFVIDFGQKVGEPFLSSPLHGCLNVHPSLLPLYRGAAPVPRAILDGKTETGVTVFQLVESMDAGPIMISEKVKIGENETTGELLFRLAYIGSVLLNRGVKLLAEDSFPFQDQNSQLATYACKIEKSETLLNPEQTAIELHNRVRAFNPSPGSYITFRKKRLKIWSTKIFDFDSTGAPGEISFSDDNYPLVQTLRGKLKLLEVQPEGKRRVDGAEWLKGSHLKEGDLLI